MTPDGRIKFGRITHLLLENFKAFGRLQRVPIRPITLIYGRNNSGKSSVIQALLYAQHAQRTGEMDPYRVPGSLGAHFEGGLARIRHGHDNAIPKLGWEWENQNDASV